MTDDVQMVVARYREDISWIPRTGIHAIIYDKSGSEGAYALPNIGRESHTYLHHILQNYPVFPKYCLFLQADPFPHLPEGTTPESLVSTVLSLIAKNVPFKGLAYYSIKCDHWGRPHTLWEPENDGKWAGFGQDIPVGQVYSQLFFGPVPLQYHSRAPAGIFLVHKDRILVRPMAFYENAMSIIQDDPDDLMNTGHAFERLWYLIFNGHAALHNAPRQKL